jgi:hypothetical protein
MNLACPPRRRKTPVRACYGRHPVKLPSWPKAALPVLTLAAAALLLARPRPMFVNIGAADEPLVRGFQEWERAGPEGRTMFRWSRDGATIELPAAVQADNLQLRVRLARFLPQPIELTWRVNGREALRQTVRPRGWHLETLDVGPVSGPLVIEIRSFAEPDGVGAAVDWVEIHGARSVVPRRRALVAGLALILGAPLAAHLIAGSRAAHTVAGALLVAVSFVLWVDPARGLAAITEATPAVFVCLGVFALVGRFRPTELQPAFAAAAVVSVFATLALFHPAFHYPDVDTHARLLAAIRQEPSLALDPSPYQELTGAWTRGIGGRKVAFPYSPMFHVVAWPFALIFGEIAAIKLLAAAAVGTSVLLVHRLARGLGLGVGGALLAQVLFAALPVISSRLLLALFPTLFAQALELGLLAALGARLPLADPRSATLVAGFMAITQLSYTGSLVNVAAFTGVLVLMTWAAGEKTTAGRLAMITAGSTIGVGLLLYARFLPVLWADVLPHAASGGAPIDGVTARTVARLFHFFGPVYPLLVLAACVRAETSEAPTAGRRVLLAALLAGLALLALRGVAPALVRDVKEIELLAGPMAVFAAAALTRLARERAGRWLAGVVVTGLVGWGLYRAVLAFLQNVVAIDR